MSDPVKLVPTKPDAELAEELKQELLEALQPACVIATRALALGFQVQMNMSADAFKIVRVGNLQLLKIF